MNPFGNPSSSSFETGWEKGQSAVKQLVKPVFKQTKQITQAATQQLMGTPVRTDPVSDFPKSETHDGSAPDQKQATPLQHSAQPSASNPGQPTYGKGHMSGTDMQLSQTRAKLAALQRQHNVAYFDQLVNRPKRQELPVAEKIEQEKQQASFELMKKEEKKKKDNIALKMSTHRAEMFRGAAG